ncbi:SLC13 family permease [Neoactinobaculum massilliense]|uniref:SLC13 family permease n=1 Tax=Neoactinobaculum massilliense TaxID=2364794 RepID=UPI000F52AB9C|nr:SLC13 family permease [Neoactinobaculum massilliense]
MNAAEILVAAAIVVSIGLGYALKLNVGLIAMSFAYLIGAFVMGIKPADVIASWPVSLFFVIFAVGLFYNFAVVNGTMDALANILLYRFRRFPNAIYIVLFLIAVILAGTGAGFFTTMAAFCPIAVRVTQKMGKNILIGAQAANWGACAGANLMTSGDGVVFQRLIATSGFAGREFSLGIPIFLFTLIYPLLALCFLWVWEHLRSRRLTVQHGTAGSASFAPLYDAASTRAQALLAAGPSSTPTEPAGANGVVLTRGRASASQPDRVSTAPPAPLTRKQKQTLGLIALTFVLVLIFPLLALWLPRVSVIEAVNANINIGLICVLMSVVALLMGLGEQKEVIARVPWNTIIMICGMGMLIDVATKAGLVDTLSGFLGGAIPDFWLPVAFCLVAGIMSFFSSTLSVVTPTLFPVVGALCAANPALNPALLFTAVAAGSLSTNISPFSSAGSLMQVSFPAERRLDMFNKQIFAGLPVTFALALVSVLILTVVG